MDILGGVNQPVEFYTKNTGNSVNTIISSDNQPVVSNVFSPELNEFLVKKNHQKYNKRLRQNKRLNTIDSEYLPDESTAEPDNLSEEENIFKSYYENRLINKIKKFFAYFVENTPLVNYFSLKRKKYKIQKTVSSLNDISQNVDELLNTAVPYGEEKNLYGSIVKNLNDAVTIIGEANKYV